MSRTMLPFCCMLFLTGAPAFAQYRISGSIREATGEPLINAVITARQPSDSSLVQSALSDSTGRFQLTMPQPRPVLLMAGYPEQAWLIPEAKGDTVVTLVPANQGTGQLAGVTVKARVPLLERKPDRTIFNVAASITAIGSNAYEAVRKTPGVVVREGDNTIALTGRSGVRVLVNDRLIQLSGEDLTAYLQAIPSDQIDRIEVITTPPAQYDAAGNAGLLNIVLKKNRRSGFNGTVRAGYEQATYGTGIAGASINYRRGKLNVYGDAGYTKGAKGNHEHLETYYPGQVFQLDDPYKKRTQNLQYTIGADYEPGKNQVLGVQYSREIFDRNDRAYTTTNVVAMDTRQPDSVIITQGYSHTDRGSHELNLNYVWTIDTAGRKLTLNANRFWFRSGRDKTSITDIYYGATGLPTGTAANNRNTGRQAIPITTAQADLALPFHGVQLSAGGKLSYAENNSGNDFLNFVNGSYQADPDISDAFSYTEIVSALYLSAQRAIGKWSLQGGLRAEMTDTKGYSRSLDQTNKTDYLDLFPTAFVSYKPEEAQVLSLSYSRRINRPGYAELNPFRLYTSPYSYNEGNPFLKPSYSHALELGYTLNSACTFSAYYQLEQNHFGQQFFTDAATKVNYMTNANLSDIGTYGVSASASWTPFKWWEVQATANGNIQQNKLFRSGGDETFTLPNLYLSASNSFRLNRAGTLLAEANIFYLSRYQNDQFYFNSIASVDTGIKAVLMDKKLTVSLNASDIFATQQTRAVNQVTGQTLDSYFDQRNLRLMLHYKLGNDKVRTQRERSTGLEPERGRV